LKENSGGAALLPHGTTHLAGHGFIGTLTALVAAGRLDLATGVRLSVSSPDLDFGWNRNARHHADMIDDVVLSAFLSALVEPSIAEIRHDHSLRSTISLPVLSAVRH